MIGMFGAQMHASNCISGLRFFNQKMRAYNSILNILNAQASNMVPDELASRVHVLAKFNYSVCLQF